jgi:hypothetical protein
MMATHYYKSLKIYVVAAGLFLSSHHTAIAENWEYRSKKDQMRDEEYSYAQANSENEAQFSFPYNGGSKLSIIVRKKNNNLDAVIFSISKGQFSCGVSECEGAVKFIGANGKGKVESLSLSGAADYSSDVLFASNEDWFVKKLKASKEVVIELPFYQHGNVQFSFDVSGLKF